MYLFDLERGLGLFGDFSRSELILFVVGVWLVEILWSWWWLKHFRFGPLEWVWRTLVYRRRQPFRQRATAA